MYLSLLHVNVDHRPGRQWLGDLYRIHQRLWMAFPNKRQSSDDPYFLAPWTGPSLPDPKPTRAESGFLFRVERDGPARILVQSMERPDWKYAFQNAPCLLVDPAQVADPAQVREFNPMPRDGAPYRFRVLTHVVKRSTVAREEMRTTRTGQTIAKRRRKETWIRPAPMPQVMPTDADERERILSARWDEWRNWLKGMGDRAGFQILDEPATPLRMQAVPDLVFHPHPGNASAPRSRKSTLYNGGLFEGVLMCVDPDKLRAAIIDGIGPAKAFGFGLLSIAPVR